jgi:nucleoside-diphosphate-sugar epimerase
VVQKLMKIVVTGGMGKVGQYVVRELTSTDGSRMPHEVVVFDLIRGPEQGPVRYVGGDIRDLGQVVGVLAGADAVIDLAAIHRDGITTNDVTFETNVLGAFNVHEAAWRLGIRRVVSTSSISVLGWDGRERDFLPEYLPIDEAHPLAPQDTYGVSKQLAEEIARSYTNKCGMETVVLRTPGVVSPEQLDAWRQTGRPAPDRFLLCSYIDGRDLAGAYRLAVERPLPGHTLLFVCADDSSVAEPLATLFPRLLPELGEMARSLTGSMSSISNARAKRLLGWKPEHSWRDLTP